MKINHKNCVIELTKTEMKEAETFGSEMYIKIQKLLRGLALWYCLQMSSSVKSKYACSVTSTLECPRILLRVNRSMPFIRHLLAKLFLRQWGQYSSFRPILLMYLLKLVSKLWTLM